MINLAKALHATLLCSLFGLLYGCASPAPVSSNAVQPSQHAPTPAATPVAPAIVPAHQRELSGTLLGIPARAQVELALLAIDPKGRPYSLLAHMQLPASGDSLAFQLPFDAERFALHRRVELRARAHLDGRLILRLPPQPIPHAENRQLGSLRLVPAP
ncbi:hypothetical protein [Pseudomonas xionganensis]|uniref:hypothetical protein n=1 Tax=Pseudomonas xionganensis TaxID=2654845 RepID=UPI00389A25E4